MFIRLKPTGTRSFGAALVVCLFLGVLCGCGDSNSSNMSETAFRQTNLVSDVAGQAATMDANLVNAWGIARGPTTAFWISDNGQGVSTLYNGAGQPFPVGQALVVTIPPPAGSPADTTAAPTGVVFNDTSDFMITDGMHSGPSAFIFATEDGTLSGWNRDVSASAAILAADNSAMSAVYKGLALGSNASGNFILATNFRAARIDVFDKNFAAASLSGSFADPNIPDGFAPFGIATIQGGVYVTYAKQDDMKHDDVAGPGNGFVNIFDMNGNLLRRFATDGALDSPWGVVLAPAGFGGFGNTILVGNFGNGMINAFDPASGKFLGRLSDGHNAITIDGLWGLSFGNGGNAGDANTLFFTAGPNKEMHGLFGSLQAVGGGM